MVDFTKDKTWADSQVIENNADDSNMGKGAGLDFTGDLDTLITNKTVHAGGGSTNKPVGAPEGRVLVLARSSSETSQVFFARTNDRMYFRRQATSVWTDWVELFHSSNAASLPLSTAFAPADDNTHSNGDASGRWSEIFAGNGAINTSDAREKTEILTFTFDEIEASKQLASEIGTYKFLASVDKKGDLARTHIGLTVQRAIEIMESNNLDPMSYGFICFDSWAEKVEAILDSEGEAVLDADDQPTYKVIKEAGDRYGFRYDQLNQFIIAGFNARLDAAGI